MSIGLECRVKEVSSQLKFRVNWDCPGILLGFVAVYPNSAQTTAS